MSSAEPDEVTFDRAALGSRPPLCAPLPPAAELVKQSTVSTLVGPIRPRGTHGVKVAAHWQHTIASCLSSASCPLIPVTTLGELTVLAHTDGDTVLAVTPEPDQAQVSNPERKAKKVLSSIFRTGTFIVFPAGWIGNHKAKVLVAPIPFAPPPEAIVRTHAQRALRHARRPGIYFMLVAALVGGSSYDAAATAFARAASFRQSYASALEATLAGQVIQQAVNFHFGGKAITSLPRGRDPAHCEVGSIAELTLKSLKAESDLRDALFSFHNPSSQQETDFIHEWGGAVTAFDPADIPEGACSELPKLQERSLMDVPFSHPTPILVSSWVPQKPESAARSALASSIVRSLLGTSPSVLVSSRLGGRPLPRTSRPWPLANLLTADSPKQ